MTVERINNAPVLDQLEGHYEKLLLILLRKYKPNGVIITAADMEQILSDNTAERDPYVLLTHGHGDSIEFKAIRKSAAEVLAKHHAENFTGRA